MPGADETNSDYPSEPPVGVFTVEIATPGGSSADWRPFPAQEFPLAEYARQIAERFDFKVEVIDLTADRDLDTSRPGVILIDPRFITVGGGRTRLEAAVLGLPKWVLPLIVMAQSEDGAQSEDLADQVRDILFAAGALRARSARRGARGVSSFRAFSLLMRDLVLEAEGQYIPYRSRQRYGNMPISRPLSSRSGPLMPTRPDDSASVSDSLGETPHAR